MVVYKMNKNIFGEKIAKAVKFLILNIKGIIEIVKFST